VDTLVPDMAGVVVAQHFEEKLVTWMAGASIVCSSHNSNVISPTLLTKSRLHSVRQLRIGDTLKEAKCRIHLYLN
jgi:hypothetical protein